MKRYKYRPGKGEESRSKVLVSETPVLIKDLRPGEQNIAYETVFKLLPADRIREFYDIQLQRLKGIREAIVASEEVMKTFELCYVRHKLHVNGVQKATIDKAIARLRESRDERAETEERGGEEGTEGEEGEEGEEEQRAWEGYLAFKGAVRERNRWQACKRAVARLLVMCEDVGKEILGFQKVVWQADQLGDEGRT